MSNAHILVADIGGTNSRFAVFRICIFGLCERGSVYERRGRGWQKEDEGYIEKTSFAMLSLERSVVLPTQKAGSLPGLIRALSTVRGKDGGYFLPSSPEPQPLAGAVLAVPAPAASVDPASAPVHDEVCRCPNINWPISWTEAWAALGVSRLHLINDFVAQGFACAAFEQTLNLDCVVKGKPRANSPLALIGAGTGLGQCLILHDGHCRVLPSEGGHSLFPFAGEEEFAFAAFLQQRTGSEQIVKDMVVSGSGLAHIHAFLTGERLRPDQVTSRLSESPKTLEWFACFYARACRDFILTTLPLGGIYITGGVAGHIPGLLRHPAFTATLRGVPSMAHVLRDIPVLHIRNQDAGLWGAAAFAALGMQPDATLIASDECEDEVLLQALLRETGARG